MSAGTCASLCCALIFVGVSVCADQDIITAESGQTVILPCRVPNNNPIRAVAWTKPALENEHVYLYRDGRFDPEEQNPIFKNRVDLQDRQMKDGNVSLILKDVTVSDDGTYKCHVIQSGTSRSIKAPTISIITLRVVGPPGQPGGTSEDGGKEGGGKEDGAVGLIAGLSVCAVLLVAAAAAAAFLIYRKAKLKSNSSGSQIL